ncbi:lecithin retinol acyltransferase family protein [Paraburkholderia sacchari]|uniref:lecithin retinol acyltransferase family protein n=1 Tax=Paraburkholderia sacchari TaxID=159450 RepID=UPI001BCEBB00|nr:lecithin retinol acyltransferase family protein [Paraburkholderia sacchari]
MGQREEPECTDVLYTCDLCVGAHLATRRPGYVHHGIYIGNGRVIHYAGFSRHLGSGPVEVISIEEFSAGFGLLLVPHPHAQYTGREIARRAASRLGEHNYKLLTNNCEHLCLWCVLGQGRSHQVDACMRNPARAVRVLFTLLLCKVVRDWMQASSGRTVEVPIPEMS